MDVLVPAHASTKLPTSSHETELCFANPTAEGRQWKLVQSGKNRSGRRSSRCRLTNPSADRTVRALLLQLTSSDMIPKPKSSGPSFGKRHNNSNGGRLVDPTTLFDFGCPCCAMGAQIQIPFHAKVCKEQKEVETETRPTCNL